MVAVCAGSTIAAMYIAGLNAYVVHGNPMLQSLLTDAIREIPRNLRLLWNFSVCRCSNSFFNVWCFTICIWFAVLELASLCAEQILYAICKFHLRQTVLLAMGKIVKEAFKIIARTDPRSPLISHLLTGTLKSLEPLLSLNNARTNPKYQKNLPCLSLGKLPRLTILEPIFLSNETFGQPMFTCFCVKMFYLQKKTLRFSSNRLMKNIFLRLKI